MALNTSLRTSATLVGVLFALVLFGGYSLNTKEEAWTSWCRDAGDIQSCTRSKIQEAAGQGDIAGAAAFAYELDKKDAEFHKQCHLAMHDVGVIAYGLLTKGERVDLGEDTSVCKNGFYHGMMLAYETDNGTLAGADGFCRRTTAAIGDAHGSVRILKDCFHGIGNGIVQSLASREADAVFIMDEAPPMCAKTTEGEDARRECVGGIYGYLATLSRTGDVSFPEYMNADPLSLCATQEEAFRSLCYGYFSKFIFTDEGNDLGRALDAYSRRYGITGEHARVVVRSLGALAGARLQEDESDSLKAAAMRCRAYPTLKDACLNGVVSGLASRRAGADDFRALRLLCSYADTNERECLAGAAAALNEWTKPQEVRRFCTLIGERDSPACGART